MFCCRRHPSTMQADCELIILAGQKFGLIEGPLWGQFLELTGRNVNGRIYDPDSPHARDDDVRVDVLEALRELRPTHICYPGRGMCRRRSRVNGYNRQ